MKSFLRQFLLQARGATAIEYALICAMIFLVILVAVGALGTTVSNTYDKITAAM